MTKFARIAFLCLACTGLSTACSNRTCREFRDPELARASAQPSEKEAGQMSNGKPPGSSGAPAAGKTIASTAAQPMNGSVRVFKPDGSLQCGVAKGLSLDEMEKQLAGVRVLSRDKRHDGLMHIQVCGHPTGMINVFEIPAESLKDAEAKGFKKLDRN